MARSSVVHSGEVEIIPATLEQQPILDNLLQFYAHDFMDFYALELDEEGRFRYENLPLYWSDTGRHPFLVRIDGRLAGFVLIRRGSEITGSATAWDMTEFFILRGFRRRGAGTQIAYKVWKRFPGSWEVRVLEANRSAQRFWKHAISTFTGRRISPTTVKHDEECWKLFSFESTPPA